MKYFRLLFFSCLLLVVGSSIYLSSATPSLFVKKIEAAFAPPGGSTGGGNPPAGCSSGANPHYECHNSACILVATCGTNACTSNAQCVVSNPGGGVGGSGGGIGNPGGGLGGTSGGSLGSGGSGASTCSVSHYNECSNPTNGNCGLHFPAGHLIHVTHTTNCSSAGYTCSDGGVVASQCGAAGGAAPPGGSTAGNNNSTPTTSPTRYYSCSFSGKQYICSSAFTCPQGASCTTTQSLCTASCSQSVNVKLNPLDFLSHPINLPINNTCTAPDKCLSSAYDCSTLGGSTIKNGGSYGTCSGSQICCHFAPARSNPKCGDKVCDVNAGEDCASCPEDCGSCPSSTTCTVRRYTECKSANTPFTCGAGIPVGHVMSVTHNTSCAYSCTDTGQSCIPTGTQNRGTCNVGTCIANGTCNSTTGFDYGQLTCAAGNTCCALGAQNNNGLTCSQEYHGGICSSTSLTAYNSDRTSGLCPAGQACYFPSQKNTSIGASCTVPNIGTGICSASSICANGLANTVPSSVCSSTTCCVPEKPTTITYTGSACAQIGGTCAYSCGSPNVRSTSGGNYINGDPTTCDPSVGNCCIVPGKSIYTGFTCAQNGGICSSSCKNGASIPGGYVKGDLTSCDPTASKCCTSNSGTANFVCNTTGNGYAGFNGYASGTCPTNTLCDATKITGTVPPCTNTGSTYLHVCSYQENSTTTALGQCESQTACSTGTGYDPICGSYTCCKTGSETTAQVYYQVGVNGFTGPRSGTCAAWEYFDSVKAAAGQYPPCSAIGSCTGWNNSYNIGLNPKILSGHCEINGRFCAAGYTDSASNDSTCDVHGITHGMCCADVPPGATAFLASRVQNVLATATTNTPLQPQTTFSTTLSFYSANLTQNQSSAAVSPQVIRATDLLTYNPTLGLLVNSKFNLNTIPPGNYKVYTHIDGYLDTQLFTDQNTDIITPELNSILNLPVKDIIPGDIAPDPHGDNFIDIQDYNRMISCMLGTACPNQNAADLNHDGRIDENDLQILLSHFGEVGSQFTIPEFNCVTDPQCATAQSNAIQLCPLKCTKTPIIVK